MVDGGDDRSDDLDDAAGDGLSGIHGAAGVVLAGGAWLPLTVDGPTFIALAQAILADLGFAGVPLVLMLGAPFLFGVALAVAGLIGAGRVVTAGIAGLVAILQADLVYMSLQAWRFDQAIARGALVGFALVTSGAMIAHVANARARGVEPTLRWYVRWGALVIAGMTLWLRLQALAGAPIGAAIDALVIGAAIVAWAARPRRAA